MKKYFVSLLASLLLLSGCDNGEKTNTIMFATSADYPPFEYYSHGEIKGFDIELASMIAKELGKEAVFEDMQFSAILPALRSGSVDAAISTITITVERKTSFDFSDPYYTENLAAVFLKDNPVTSEAELIGKKVACQLGTTMEIWLKKHAVNTTVIVVDSNNQAIEALKAGHVDIVLMDGFQGATYSKQNPALAYNIIAKSDDGYGIAFKKGSPLKEPINQAIKTLKKRGDLEKLQQKWLM